MIAAVTTGPRCRSCGGALLEDVFSLGELPLANALVSADKLQETEPVFPLDLAFCPECGLAQITHAVPPSELFLEYPYFSSYSDTMLDHARELSRRIVEQRGLTDRNLVVELASNDGYLLRHYRAAGVPVLGVEPARNVAEVAIEERGVPTLCEFFTDELAARLVAEGRRADVIHAHNVLAHVPDLNGFVAGMRRLLAPTGVALIEVPYLADLVSACAFDTIYHEHLCYFSLTSLRHLLERNGLTVVDVERLGIHGGSLRLTVARSGECGTPWPAVAELLAKEAASGSVGLDALRGFAERVVALRRELRGLLGRLRGEGGRIAAYGAAAKGSILMGYCGIGTETIDFVVDRNPHKQGKYMPGSHLPICGPERLLSEMPDFVLLLSWNWADEVLRQQQEYRSRGGRFIIPVPTVRIT